MFPFLTRAVDRLAIRMACPTVYDAPYSKTDHEEAHRLLADAAFLTPVVGPTVLEFDGNESNLSFSFDSPLSSPWPINNRVVGRCYRAGHDWRRKPMIILLHGWNGEYSYEYLFPWLAKQLNKRGMNVAMIQLPYHGRRRPREPGSMTNFLTTSLRLNLAAIRQALGDIQAVVKWAKAEGCPSVGLWGHSMGAYLSGMIISSEVPIETAILMAPVCRMDRVVEEMDFCKPLRERWGDAKIEYRLLNLVDWMPKTARENILIIKPRFDLFASPGTIEELCEEWKHPELWTPAHGHVTILGSLGWLKCAADWLSVRVADLQANHKGLDSKPRL